MRASVLDYWEYGNDYWLVNPSSLAPYPAFYAVKQLADNLPPGTNIVDAISDHSAVLVIAAKNDSRQKFMVHVIKDTGSSQSVSFQGLPNSTLTWQRISANENMGTVGTYTPSGGSLTFTLSAQSINTLSGSLSSALPDLTPPTSPKSLMIR